MSTPVVALQPGTGLESAAAPANNNNAAANLGTESVRGMTASRRNNGAGLILSQRRAQTWMQEALDAPASASASLNTAPAAAPAPANALAAPKPEQKLNPRPSLLHAASSPQP
jgi:hypothetical protein